MQKITPRLSNESVKAATGKGWDEWTAILDAAGARDWAHADIAKWLRSEGHVPQSWWNQAVTIGYEQAIGKRQVGQNCTGDLTTNASKAVPYDLDTALQNWQTRVGQIEDFNGTVFASEPRVSSSEKWRYWRATFEDGTSINVNISIKDSSKSSIGIEHSKLADHETAAQWKLFWKEVLGKV